MWLFLYPVQRHGYMAPPSAPMPGRVTSLLWLARPRGPRCVTRPIPPEAPATLCGIIERETWLRLSRGKNKKLIRLLRLVESARQDMPANNNGYTELTSAKRRSMNTVCPIKGTAEVCLKAD